MADERWMPVAGFEGYYEVSDRGRVRGVDRTVRCRGVGLRKIRGKNRPAQKRSNGYLYVTLCKHGVRQQLSVHRLVAEAFIPNPKNLPQVNHKDENKANNSADNLEWCDSVYNRNYGTGLSRSSDKRSIAVVAINDFGKEVARFRSGADAEKMTGISKSSISSCLHGKIEKAGGYRWEYDSDTNRHSSTIPQT